MFGTSISDRQFDAHLETLAKLIEASAKTVEEAAQIVRDAKLENQARKEENLRKHPELETENLAIPEIHMKDNDTI